MIEKITQLPASWQEWNDLEKMLFELVKDCFCDQEQTVSLSFKNESYQLLFSKDCDKKVYIDMVCTNPFKFYSIPVSLQPEMIFNFLHGYVKNKNHDILPQLRVQFHEKVIKKNIDAFMHALEKDCLTHNIQIKIEKQMLEKALIAGPRNSEKNILKI